MELERPSAYRGSFQASSSSSKSMEYEFDGSEGENGKISSPNAQKSIAVHPEESSSSGLPHWSNRRGKLFALKALAIILLLGYVGHERWLSVVEKVTSRRRLTYVSPPSSQLSQTVQQHLSVESSTNTTASLRGTFDSNANMSSETTDGAAPKDN